MGDRQPPTWLHNRVLGYAPRCTLDLNIAIAEDVWAGAFSLTAAMRHGVSPSQFREWMQWGEEAYRADVSPDHYHYPYADLFRRMMMALGETAVEAQRRAYERDPIWWLTHHPETRDDWSVAVRAHTDAAVAVVEATPAQIEAPRATGAELRDTLRRLIQSNAAVNPLVETTDATDAPIVDAAQDDATNGADNDDDAATDRQEGAS